MTFDQLLPLLTGSGGAIVVLILWVKSLRSDKETLENACKDKDATIERLHNENKTLAMEYATNATRIISTLQELKPCQYKPQANS
jgi:FtsZ-binding cell division protein ZapB